MHEAPSCSGAAATRLPQPAREIGRILDRPPPVLSQRLEGEARLTARWTHGPLHDSLPPLDAHVVMAYHGRRQQDVVWRTDGRRMAARSAPGTVTVIPAGQDGRWDLSGPVEVSHLYLPDARLQALAGQLTGGRKVELLGRVGFEDPAASRLMEMLSRESDLADPSSRLFAEQAIDLLSTHLVRAHSSFRPPAVERPRRGLADWQVRKVTAFMRDNLEEEIGLEDLARLVSLSRHHFATAFRLATGRTPHEWLVAERVARARELLEHSSLAVTEVGLSVGYQTPSSFSAAFRKSLGVSPTEYRRRL